MSMQYKDKEKDKETKDNNNDKGDKTDKVDNGDKGGDKILYGTKSDDALKGGKGNDIFYGFAGDDSINGGAGYDYLVGGQGDDALDGGTSWDAVDYYDATAGIIVDLDLGTATGEGVGTDTLSNIEGVYGSYFADSITGGQGNDYFWGSTGNDSLDGGAGDDILYGWTGDDVLTGGDGKDTAWFYGNFADYKIAYDTNTDTLTIGDKTTYLWGLGEGTDTITGVERFQFAGWGLRATTKSLADLIKVATGTTGGTTDGVVYSVTKFVEAAANDGSIATKSTLKLTGDTFADAVGTDLSAFVTNVPTGLTASLIVSTAKTATLSFIGAATAHANSDDVNNLTVTLPATAFTKGVAVSGATKTGLVMDFIDVATTGGTGSTPDGIAYSVTKFVEAAANDGSIATKSTLKLTGDTFADAVGTDLGSLVTNVPAGLVASLVVSTANTAILSFTGAATAHANSNDVNNLTVTLPATAFTKGVAVSGATNAGLVIDFADAATASSSTVAVSAAGTSSASTGDVTFNVAVGNYTHNITGFAANDKVKFDTGAAISINNTSLSDGIIDVVGALSGNAVTVHLTGVATASDGVITDLTSFNTVFGAGALA